MISAFQQRPIRFLEIFEAKDTVFKYYSISNRNSVASDENIGRVKHLAPVWYASLNDQGFETHNVAILIVHEVAEGTMGIISRWIDGNMLQTQVYLATHTQPDAFTLFSNHGITTCVWELEVLWFERNAWIKHVYLNPGQPDALGQYLQEQLHSPKP